MGAGCLVAAAVTLAGAVLTLIFLPAFPAAAPHAEEPHTDGTGRERVHI